jgi:hypothetical protein
VGDPSLLACASFVESLRRDRRPFADERVGWASAVPVALGNEAIYNISRVESPTDK